MTFRRNGDQATDMNVDINRKRVEIRCLRLDHETGHWDVVYCESHPLSEILADLGVAS